MEDFNEELKMNLPKPMKKYLIKLSLATGLSISIFSLQPSAFSQGSLTPPGSPAPTMKSLDQIEARTPITNRSSLVTILQPGSYYLTHNLTVSSGDAIDIATNGVTLDLNGFTISSTAASASGNAILLNSSSPLNITIANGFIRGGVTNNGSGVYSGGGFGYGINYSSGAPANVLVSRLAVSGCLYSGIYLTLGNSDVVDSCSVRTAGNYGIWATAVKQSTAVDCGNAAVAGYTVSDSYGQSINGEGIFAINALNCSGTSSSSIGVYGNTAQNCYGQSVSSIGIDSYAAENCWGECDGNGNYGIYTFTAANCYGAVFNGFGTSGYGVYAVHTATGCDGWINYGTGLYAFVATGCHGGAANGTSVSATHSLNSF